MRRAALALLAASGAACASLTGARDIGSSDLDREAGAAERRFKEDRARSSLGRIEAALADYYKERRRAPDRLEELVPKYLAALPALDLPACGRETDEVENYPPSALREGRVDGSRLRATGRWGYVHDEERIVVFVDCPKRSLRGAAWHQERGAY